MKQDYKEVYSLTDPQRRFIETLSIDLRYNRKQMYDVISTILGYEVKDIDKLKIAEASKVIAELKRRKE